MRLQRLEINGFKSFSDRSELAFDTGVTAIVGPNGCGKSNLADAITWVMGEQSAKSLRGERMEDVIFNGSDARKPTAAAEVRLRFSGLVKALTHDNGHHRNGRNGHHRANGNGNAHVAEPDGAPAESDGSLPESDDSQPESTGSLAVSDRSPVQSERSVTVASSLEEAEQLIQSIAREVEVTRRLYRSGESEYLIDGRVCRLKDVHDLLMDTGLGAKAYAIIEQGKIGLILSSRPSDRRQLIEEAAGITKYKSRRRAAELKLEAARQNLTRIDDIVFEVDKQRITLKRQAAKARRYQRLREELRRWEKVLFARKYRQLSETIQAVRGRLDEARDRDAVSAARVAEIETDIGRIRLALVSAESDATKARESAHARELAINRQQQQLTFDREQLQALDLRAAAVAAELEALDLRREPAHQALAACRQAAADANEERDRAAVALASESEAYESAHREIEGLEADVEAARSEVFSAINAATALRHALEHGATARDRVLESLSKLEVETSDVRIQSDRAAGEMASATEARRLAVDALETTRVTRSAREAELASARIEHEWRARSVRAREQELAGLEARLKSLEELEAARSGYSDAARAVLADAGEQVSQQGAVADYLEVDPGYERAVEACLGDLVQHVVVRLPEQAAAGFLIARESGAGRCGFLIVSAAGQSTIDNRQLAIHGSHSHDALSTPPVPGVLALSSLVRVNGPFADAIRPVIGESWIAPTYQDAADASRHTTLAVASLAGDVFHGPHLVAGGTQAESRGILETKRAVKELRERIAAERETLSKLVQETAELEGRIVHVSNAIAVLDGEHHTHEKVIAVHNAQLEHIVDEQTRLAQKGEQLIRERRQAEEEREALDRRQEEARASIARLQDDQRLADERLTLAQRRLFEVREAADEWSRRAAEVKAHHAALVERAGALASEAHRLDEAAMELEQRASALLIELEQGRARVGELQTNVAACERELRLNIGELDELTRAVMRADDGVAALRASTEEHEEVLKQARATLEAARGVVSELEIVCARAEADLSHLAHTCEDAVHAPIEEVALEVERLEQEGKTTPDAALICAEDPEDGTEDGGGDGGEPVVAAEAALVAAERRALSAEEAIGELRGKIDHLGPVNMMAIEQFDELEKRHHFLSSERKDLVEAIAQTTEAIVRIDETTRQRFSEAFAAINGYFQETFTALFGGGRAGLTLLDENDPLESGIEIIAQPPGKRLQSVQLLSGGEKALTAIALMFGMFKYKPSPFCLLDEIDAPLDDANIARFIEMLRGMQLHTQFIVITHNRKTMEIADRLYGVTMEEPGVSKLISVQLN